MASDRWPRPHADPRAAQASGSLGGRDWDDSQYRSEREHSGHRDGQDRRNDPRFRDEPGSAADPRYGGGRGRAPDPRNRGYGGDRAPRENGFGPGSGDPRKQVQPRAIESRRLAIEPPPRGQAPGGSAQHFVQPSPPARQSPQALPSPPGIPPGQPGLELPARAGQRRRPGENTRAVHLPDPAPPRQPPLTTPVYRTTTFTFGSSAEHAAVLADAAPGFSYSRIDNPTVEAFCAAVAALEGVSLNYVPAAQAFASGMAAISTVFLALTRAGSHVVAPSAVYGGTYSFLRHVAGRFGVHVEFVDMTDLALVRAAIRPETAVVYAETLANPTAAVTDLAGVARLAHEAGAALVVDSTLAPPVICRPLEHGADLVLHSATKYFGGHSDVTGGVVTGHPELLARVRFTRIDTGGSLGPDDSYLLRRGLETLPLRVRRQCATAHVLAAALVRHPAVRAVHYPGLAGHPGHELAKRQFDAGPEGTRFGSIVTVAPFGGREAGMAFADRLGLARLAASLGGTYTKVSHVGSTTHRQMDDAALAAAGIDQGAVRYSVGLEDAEDLIADAITSLDSLGR
jgi:cystathionine beta-lyase/cystathionine gamma-synthase